VFKSVSKKIGKEFAFRGLNIRTSVMKKQDLILSLIAIISFTSCVEVHDHGPHGRTGDAYFGVDFHYAPPFSYWDNNPSIPENPYLGDFYWTEAGTYDFEYFVNPYDYWFGYYTIYRNGGTPGGSYGEPGLDGLDTYLILYCDPSGWHEDRFEHKQNVKVIREKDKVTVEVDEPGQRFKLEMFKTDIIQRPTKNNPKWAIEDQEIQ
jgi:hypothetical protein